MKKLPPRTRRIDPLGVYTRDELAALFAVPPRAISNEIAEGRLAYTRRLGRYYFLGEWLLDWLRAGKLTHIPRKQREAV